MNVLVIKDIPLIEKLSDEAARKIAGGRINLRTDEPVKPASEPTGGMGYTGIMIHYTLTVIE
jgi:hypothetical protein